MKNKYDRTDFYYKDYIWALERRWQEQRFQNKYNLPNKYRFKIEEIEVDEDFFEPIQVFDKKTTKKILWMMN